MNSSHSLRLAKTWIFTALATVLPSLVQANGTRLASQDAFAISRGYAYVATADNPSAVYYNPAGLGLAKTTTLLGGTYVLSMDIEYEAPGGRIAREQSDAFAVPNLFAALPVNDRLTLGFGFFLPYGLSSDWAADSGFSTYATRSEIKYYTGEVAASYKIAEGLWFGAGLQINHNETELGQMTVVAPGVILPFGYKGDDTAPSFNLGILWQPATRHSFGLKFQSKTEFDFKGDAYLGDVLTVAGTGSWVYPENISAGYSFRPTAEWNIEFNYDWTNWDRLNQVELSAGPLSTVVPFHWKSSAYWSLGATRYFANGWDVSAGYCYSEDSVPGESFMPSLADTSRHLLNAGARYRTRNWVLAGTVQVSPEETRVVTNSPVNLAGQSFNGTYRSNILAGSLSASYTF